jgi:hypothetical protein
MTELITEELQRRISRLRTLPELFVVPISMGLCMDVSYSFLVQSITYFQTVTGIFLAEAAISILRDEHKLSGGVYTPASLGQKFIDRLQNAGFKFEKKFYEN